MKYTHITFVAFLCLILAAGAFFSAKDCEAQRRGRLVRAVQENIVPDKVDAAASAVVEIVVEANAPKASAADAKADSAPTDSVREFPGTSDQWKDSLDTDWIEKERKSHMIPKHFDNRSVLRGEQRDGHAYGRYTKADLLLWERETERLVLEGSRIFHSAELLGSTNGTSCDMCHPDASNTHAETYPKYQVQLGRAAILRDMINWCLENPCRAEPMSGDDPRMRAMEAYIQAHSTGKVVKYGKH
ncbi:MAG: hypothetical protein Q4D38_01720 [Planctomycetia bacterium]|nr:hypothetical protein [Planctomycetia bacterium]